MSNFEILKNSAIFGFGSSAGRSAYKNLEKNLIVLLLMVVFIGILIAPGWAGYDMHRGNERRTGRNRVFLNILIVFVPLNIFFWKFYFDSPSGYLSFGSKEWKILGVVLLYSTVTFLVGAVVGAGAARVRYEEEERISQAVFEEEEKNDRNAKFLIENGLAYEASSELWYDSDGTPLRILDQSEGKITFMAVGRRNKRAFIEMTPDGTFIEYSGIVDLTRLNRSRSRG